MPVTPTALSLTRSPPRFTIHHRSAATEEVSGKSWRGRPPRGGGEERHTPPRTLEHSLTCDGGSFWKFTRCLGDNGLQLRTFTAVAEHFGAAHHDAFLSRRHAQSKPLPRRAPAAPSAPPVRRFPFKGG
ncbi:unnamed protein product [Boreogadus saida]